MAINGLRLPELPGDLGQEKLSDRLVEGRSLFGVEERADLQPAPLRCQGVRNGQEGILAG